MPAVKLAVRLQSFEDGSLERAGSQREERLQLPPWSLGPNDLPELLPVVADELLVPPSGSRTRPATR